MNLKNEGKKVHIAYRVFDKETAEKMGLKEDEYVESIKLNVAALCPVCGAKLVHESGCVTCYSCGWSACE